MRQFFYFVISLLGAGFGILPGLPLFAQSLSPLPKIASLDYCADQYVLALAHRDQILALSEEAHDIHSFYRERAAGLATTGNSAEEILMLSPELVVRTWGGYGILPFLDRSKISHVSATYGSDLETLYKNISLLGQKMGRGQVAARHVERLKLRVQRLKSAPKSPLKALYLTPGGVTAGKNTTVDKIIHLAGFDSISESMNVNGWQNLPLEQIMLNPPDLIIGSFFDLPTAQSPWSLSRHKRINSMLENIPTILLPGRYLACDGLFAVEAAEFIRNKAADHGLIPPLSAPLQTGENP